MPRPETLRQDVTLAQAARSACAGLRRAARASARPFRPISLVRSSRVHRVGEGASSEIKRSSGWLIFGVDFIMSIGVGVVMPISMNKGCDTEIPEYHGRAQVGQKDARLGQTDRLMWHDVHMSLRDTLQSDLVAAMKAGDDVKKTTLRAVVTAVKTAETAADVDGELDDDAIMKLISTEVKQRTEAADIYSEAGEQDRAQNEIAEREVLQEYLPEPLSAEELETLVESVLEEGGYSTKKDMGAAIRDVMARAGGRADGKAVSGVVGRRLPS